MRAAAFIILLFAASLARAQTTEPAADPLTAITVLRNDLIDSFNKRDLPRLLSHLDPEVIVIWQNGEVCRGPGEVKAYYEKMMNGPDHVVSSVSADPQVTGRNVYGDWAISYGVMNDHFILTDGRDLAMNSKFTATIARRGTEWKVVGFHASVDAFDNPVLGIAIKRAAVWTGVIAGVVGAAAGVTAGLLLRRKRPTPA
jgi:ketosteroid isomerase-like protein